MLEIKFDKNKIENFKEDKIRMLKDILFVLYEFEKEKQNNIIEKIKRVIINVFKTTLLVKTFFI